jgi:very-short-patch-repair endonuclease
MAQGPASTTPSNVDDFVQNAIAQYRAKLLDLSSRNPLLNFRHSEKSRSHIRVVDEIPEKLFERLDAGRQMWFDPVPEPVLIPSDENLPLFQEALRKAKRTDETYKKASADMGPNPSERAKQKVEREIRNRIRIDMGFESFEPATDPKKRAGELGIQCDYELPQPEQTIRRRHNDSKIQTLFFREDLDRKLSGLRDSARSLLQDAGLSALFCAFGFLEYYESEHSDEKRFAPLVFYPLDLDRELVDGEYRYFVSGKNEEVEINVALKELLKREFALELPEWSSEEDAQDPLGGFLSKIEGVISTRRDWKVRRYVTMGLFTFSTLVMYKDLDPEKWRDKGLLHKLPLLRTLIAGAEVHGSSVASEYQIDQIQGPESLLITDADSSQHSAVIDVLKGNNLVIQGPPGTGKSQTITNIISASLYAGKTVLFVAEKMAALDVVKKRLDASGVGPFCLELHSSKTSKTAVVQSLSERLEHTQAPLRSGQVQSNLQAIQSARAALIYYAEKTNELCGDTGLTVRDILLGSATRESDRRSLPDLVGTARFGSALQMTPHIRKEREDAAANLERHMVPLKTFGKLDQHPWRGLQNCEITDLEVDRLLAAIREATRMIGDVLAAIAQIEHLATAKLPETVEGLTEIFRLIAEMSLPSQAVEVHLLRQMHSERLQETLSKLINSIECLSEAKTKLRSLVIDENATITQGSSAVRSIADRVTLAKRSELTTVELRSRVLELQDRMQTLHRCNTIAETLLQALELNGSDLRTVRAASKAIQRLNTLPVDLWTLRQSSVLAELSRSTIKKAAITCATLQRRRMELELRWDAGLVPAPSQLKTYVIALRTTNWFTSLFNSSCRAARSWMKAAGKGPSRTLDAEHLAQDLSKWAQLQEDESKFNADRTVAAAIGDRFHGVDTDFAVLEQVSDWAFDTRSELTKYGEIGQLLCKVLFESTPDQLRVLAGLSNDSSFSELLQLLGSTPDADRRSVHDRLADTSQTIAELGEILDSLSKLTFRETLPLGDLFNALDLLTILETEMNSIRRNASELNISSDTDNGSFHSLRQLTETLGYARLINSAKLPPELALWICHEIGNLRQLKDSTIELSGQLECYFRALQQVEQIAILDWQLWCQCSDGVSANLRVLKDRFARAVDHTSTLQDYVTFLLAEDSAIDCGLGPVLSAFLNSKEDYRDLAKASDFVFFRSAAEEILNADPSLRKHSGSSHDQLRAQYRQLDREFIALRRQLLAEKLSACSLPEGITRGRVSDLTELALVHLVSGQVRPRIPLRDLFRRAGKTIQRLKPCWMMSPMSVAQFLEPGNLQFDLILMDEASQIRPEEALGAVARGGQVVVVGDQMQLPPTSFFQRLSADGGADADEELEDVKQESVLEAAAARFYPPRMLKWHYRSQHGSLISFSNHEFYRDELTVFPSPYHEHPDFGVKLVQVDGVYGAGLNEAEARAVIDEAAKFMRANANCSLGIVAVNSKQADLMRELMDQLCASDPDAEAYRAKWSIELESLFIKNLENVQGDERDVIFISTVYGKDSSGNLYQRFGPINSIYGHRRLNVLFTRAKKKVVIFSSMKAEDIQEEGKSWGVRCLKGYLQYARTGSYILPTGAQSETDSEFEEWVIRNLQANGYETVPQLGFAGYRIDLAVRHPNHPGTFLCGIECDGATYHSARSVRERDRLRQEVLERLGWKIYRIWSTDWFRNPTLQTGKLLSYLKQLASE